MIQEGETIYNDRMNAGAVKFKLNNSSIWHLLHPGERLRLQGDTTLEHNEIVILRIVLLVDVSKYQGVIDFVKMKESGVDGVIIKCGQGLAQDPRYKENMRAAKAAGLARGTYWYFDSRVSPKVQAYWWWQWIKDDPGELMHFADYEENYHGDYAGWENLYIFLSQFKSLSGLPVDKIGIYTAYYYWIAHSPANSASLAWFAQFALWIAWYTLNPAIVIIPRPWTNADLIFWQYGTPVNGIMRGCQSLEIDENNYNGDRESYAQQFRLNLPPPPDPPPGENNMEIFTGTAKGTSTPNVRVRKPFPDGSPDVNGLTIGGIQPGGEFTADNVANAAGDNGRQWVHIIKVGNNPIDGWSAGYLLNYEVPTTPPPPPPPPDPVPTIPDLPYVITLGDDITYAKVTITGTLKPK